MEQMQVEEVGQSSYHSIDDLIKDVPMEAVVNAPACTATKPKRRVSTVVRQLSSDSDFEPWGDNRRERSRTRPAKRKLATTAADNHYDTYHPLDQSGVIFPRVEKLPTAKLETAKSKKKTVTHTTHTTTTKPKINRTHTKKKTNEPTPPESLPNAAAAAAPTLSQNATELRRQKQRAAYVNLTDCLAHLSVRDTTQTMTTTTTPAPDTKAGKGKGIKKRAPKGPPLVKPLPTVLINGRFVSVEDDRAWTAAYIAPKTPEKYLADRRRGHYWASREKKRQRGLQFPKWKKYYADGARLRNEKHRVNKEEFTKALKLSIERHQADRVTRDFSRRLGDQSHPDLHHLLPQHDPANLKAQPTSSTAVEPTEPLISLTLQAALAGKLLPSDDDNSLYGSASEDGRGQQCRGLANLRSPLRSAMTPGFGFNAPSLNPKEPISDRTMQLLTLPPRKLDYRADVEFLAQAQSQMSDREKEALANLVLLHEDVVENFSRTIDSADARLAQWQTAVEGAAAALKETMDEDNSVEVRLQEALLEVEDVRAERDQAESLAAALFKIVTGRQEMTVDEQLTEEMLCLKARRDRVPEECKVDPSLSASLPPDRQAGDDCASVCSGDTVDSEELCGPGCHSQCEGMLYSGESTCADYEDKHIIKGEEGWKIYLSDDPDYIKADADRAGISDLHGLGRAAIPKNFFKKKTSKPAVVTSSDSDGEGRITKRSVRRRRPKKLSDSEQSDSPLPPLPDNDFPLHAASALTPQEQQFVRYPPRHTIAAMPTLAAVAHSEIVGEGRQETVPAAVREAVPIPAWVAGAACQTDN